MGWIPLGPQVGVDLTPAAPLTAQKRARYTGSIVVDKIRKESRSATFAEQLKALPTKPGVYLMKDAEGSVIYVGKAANVRNRVRSYFQTPYGKDPKVQAMVRRIADFEFIVTETAQEALLLENLLIKERKPFYNARLKDDKTYPYIKINPKEDFPQVYFTRRVLADGARYFGPFASAGSVRKTMDLLKKLFPYRSCTKVITGEDERPCLEYYIHRCAGPCIGAVGAQEYGEIVSQVLRFLEGDSDSVERDLRAKMENASDLLEFERAAVLRDQIRAIGLVTENQKVVSAKNEDSDVVGLAHDKGETWVELFKIRRGKLIGRDHFVMEGGEFENESRILGNFILQFYEAATDVPSMLLMQYGIEDAADVENWLSEKRGRRVSIVKPQRGAKRRLVEMANANAVEALAQRRIKWLNESDKVLRALAELQEALSLPVLPSRIECYDISNIQGTNSVGSMVVFENGRPKASQYRRFQIKHVEGIDDYGSMQEMLRRRFRRLGDMRRDQATAELANGTSSEIPDPTRQESGVDTRLSSLGSKSHAPTDGGTNSFGYVPDLVIIDGGRGHLNAIQQVFLELGLTDIALCSLAKREEEVFLPHMAEPVILPPQSQGLYMVQRIRDEAHRFAITYHRQRRSKAAIRSQLDQAPGIGPKKRRDLLRRFGSVASIRNASLAELIDVPGISESSAVKLKSFLGGDV